MKKLHKLLMSDNMPLILAFMLGAGVALVIVGILLYLFPEPPVIKYLPSSLV